MAASHSAFGRSNNSNLYDLPFKRGKMQRLSSKTISNFPLPFDTYS